MSSSHWRKEIHDAFGKTIAKTSDNTMNARSCRQSGCLHKALSPHIHTDEIAFCASRLLQFEAHA